MAKVEKPQDERDNSAPNDDAPIIAAPLDNYEPPPTPKDRVHARAKQRSNARRQRIAQRRSGPQQPSNADSSVPPRKDSGIDVQELAQTIVQLLMQAQAKEQQLAQPAGQQPPVADKAPPAPPAEPTIQPPSAELTAPQPPGGGAGLPYMPKSLGGTEPTSPGIATAPPAPQAPATPPAAPPSAPPQTDTYDVVRLLEQIKKAIDQQRPILEEIKSLSGGVV